MASFLQNIYQQDKTVLTYKPPVGPEPFVLGETASDKPEPTALTDAAEANAILTGLFTTSYGLWVKRSGNTLGVYAFSC